MNKWTAHEDEGEMQTITETAVAAVATLAAVCARAGGLSRLTMVASMVASHSLAHQLCPVMRSPPTSTRSVKSQCDMVGSVSACSSHLNC